MIRLLCQNTRAGFDLLYKTILLNFNVKGFWQNLTYKAGKSALRRFFRL